MNPIWLHGKPMTFEEMRAAIKRDVDAEPDAELRASFERSVRRSLHRLTVEGILVAIGDGGQSDPHRYFLHPLGIAISCDAPEAQALWKELEADPGSNEALGKLFAKDHAASGAGGKP